MSRKGKPQRFPTVPLRTGQTPFSVSGSPKVLILVLDGPKDHSNATSYFGAFASSLGSVFLWPFNLLRVSVGCSVNPTLTLLHNSMFDVFTSLAAESLAGVPHCRRRTAPGLLLVSSFIVVLGSSELLS